MRFDGGDGRRGKTGEVLSQFDRHAPGEMIGQQAGIAPPGAQRRQGDDIEGQPVQQVGAELARLCHGRQVRIGGGDDPHIRCQHA